MCFLPGMTREGRCSENFGKILKAGELFSLRKQTTECRKGDISSELRTVTTSPSASRYMNPHTLCGAVDGGRRRLKDSTRSWKVKLRAREKSVYFDSGLVWWKKRKVTEREDNISIWLSIG